MQHANEARTVPSSRRGKRRDARGSSIRIMKLLLFVAGNYRNLVPGGRRRRRRSKGEL